MKLDKEVTHDDVLKHILNFNSRRDGTYVILGKPGPTGKTYLYNKLVALGYNAIDISEGIMLSNAVEYKDDANHIVELPFDYTVIILNQKLAWVF